MPELPEIESLRRALSRTILGARVIDGGVLRRDMLHRCTRAPRDPLEPGSTITALHRKGKQLVLETDGGPCVLFHLGMSGSIRVFEGVANPENHVHARWRLRRANAELVLRLRDPRRFGWIESHASMASVERNAWSRIGPDGLTIDAETLSGALHGTRRPVKAALLDQSRIAGLGNIYVDEALHRVHIHPACPVSRLGSRHLRALADSIRDVLMEAVEAGGSTIRDHRTADGRWGSFQERHGVYGRAGLPCKSCGMILRSMQVSQRMTVFCPGCQPRSPRRAQKASDSRLACRGPVGGGSCGNRS